MQYGLFVKVPKITLSTIVNLETESSTPKAFPGSAKVELTTPAKADWTKLTSPNPLPSKTICEATSPAAPMEKVVPNIKGTLAIVVAAPVNPPVITPIKIPFPTSWPFCPAETPP